MNEAILKLALNLKQVCEEAYMRLGHWPMIACVESCTGGLLAASITSVGGSSKYFDSAIVTYSNEAKEKLVHIDNELLKEHGAVSEIIAKEMAVGHLDNLPAGKRKKIIVSITGVAGPSGGSAIKPVGLVFFGLASDLPLANKFEKHLFAGSREKVRLQAVEQGLTLLIQAVELL